MKKFVVLLLGLGALTSCQTRFHTQKDDAGIYRASPTPEVDRGDLYNLPALREGSGNLVTTEETNRDLLRRQDQGESLLGLIDSKMECPGLGLENNPYKSEVHYAEALRHLEKREWDAAIEGLEIAKSFCDGFDAHSLYHYVRGIAFHNKGDRARAQKEFREFLLNAERLEPRSFTRFEPAGRMALYDQSQTAEIKRFQAQLTEARKNAQAYLDNQRATFALSSEPGVGKGASHGTDALAPNSNIAFPGNGYIKPGGNRHKHYFFLPVFGVDYRYDPVGKPYFGASGVVPLYGVHLIPRFLNDSLLGSIWGLTVRYPFFESARRDLNIEMIGHYSTARRGRVISTAYREYRLENVENGADYGAGLGATKKFTERWSISAQIDHQYLFFRDRFRTYGTAFASYAVTGWAELYTGYVKDDYQAGLTLLGLVQVGYNFRHDGISVQALSISY